jgi:hypothetical protein
MAVEGPAGNDKIEKALNTEHSCPAMPDFQLIL